MLGYQLVHESNRLLSPGSVVDLFRPYAALREELVQLAQVLREGVQLAPTAILPDGWPLRLHSTYSRREALTAVGDWDETRRPSFREGVRRVGDGAELLFVTLVKEEKHFSPTTRYRDYAISQSLFHWQSQSTTSEDGVAGQRYREQSTNRLRFYLFVRKYRDDGYRFLGPVQYVSHHGSRPMNITWRLDCPIPAALLQTYTTLVAA